MQMHPWLAVANSHREINQMMVVTQQKTRPTVDCKGTIIWSLVQSAVHWQWKMKLSNIQILVLSLTLLSSRFNILYTSPVLSWPLMYLKTLRDLRKQNQSNKLILPHIPKSKTVGQLTRKLMMKMQSIWCSKQAEMRKRRGLLNGVN